ncbi:hypothetical protein HPB47_016337, partial [Ixodes persulcatus]
MVLCAAKGNQTYNVMLLSAMHMLVRAWDQVTAATIANCFRHCGFSVLGTEAAGGDTGECEVVFEGMRDLLQDASFADSVDADSSAVICGAMTNEDIIAQVVGKPVAEAENDVDDEEEEVKVEETPIRPSAPEVMDALTFKPASEAAAASVFADAVAAVRKVCTGMDPTFTKNVTMVHDGTWMTRGHTSHDATYGFIPFTKEDCVNHVPKRMGSALRALITKAKKGKPLGGRGGLTQDLIKRLTSYYGMALRSNSDVKEMQRAVMATFYHI